jgi:hypothetical protein
LAYTFPAVPNPQPPEPDGGTFGDEYDYPHICFGGNGIEYGIWTYADYIYDALIVGDLYPCVSFIPIYGPANYGSATTTFLNTLPNAMEGPAIAASKDGRFWAMGNPNWATTYIPPVVTMFKSPGTIDENYAGPWLNGFYNQTQDLGIDYNSSVPFYGYFLSVQGLIYDEKREALYALFAAQFPDRSQNMRLYFSISRNNGQTWSKPYDISTTDFANRGLCSMALDSESGRVYIGWYDGRADKKEQNLQYYGAYIKSHVLDKLVKEMPLSLPMYLVPSQGSPTPVG